MDLRAEPLIPNNPDRIFLPIDAGSNTLVIRLADRSEDLPSGLRQTTREADVFGTAECAP